MICTRLLSFRYNTENNKSQTAAETFSLSCAGSTHPASHRFSTHWTGDIFNTALMDSVAVTIKGGYETYTPYVHPDCTGHHGEDDDEIYLRWIQFCSMSNLIRVRTSCAVPRTMPPNPPPLPYVSRIYADGVSTPYTYQTHAHQNADGVVKSWNTLICGSHTLA